MIQATQFPEAVYTIWWAGLVVTLLIFVPLAVYLLHRTWRAARSIERYAAATLEAAKGIAGSTAHVSALDTTVDVAGEMLETAEAVDAKLSTIADVLARRAG